MDNPESSHDADEKIGKEDLWFLPGPAEDPDDLPPGPRAGAGESAILAEWVAAEAGLAAKLAHVAGRLGALDDRLRRGLALIEASKPALIM